MRTDATEQADRAHARRASHDVPRSPGAATTSPSEERLTDTEIARSASRGALSTVSRTGFVMVLQTVSSLVIAHLIAPRSYGVFGLALTVVGFVRFVGDLGMTYRLEVLPTVSDEDRGRALTVGLVAAGIGALAISVLWQFLPLVQSAPDGARFVAPVIALTLLIAAPANAASVILARRLAFGRMANASVTSTVALFVIQLPLLFAGLGMWAMIIGYVTAAIVYAGLLVVAARGVPRPRRPTPVWQLLRAGIPYQAPLVAQAVVGLVVSAIVAALLGARGVGFFSWSTTLTTPILAIVFTLEAVVGPSLGKMRRDDGTRFAQATGTVLATFGVFAAAGAGAVVGIVPGVVRFIFGARWTPAVGAVEWAIVGTIPMSLVIACASITNSQNRPGRRLRASVAAGATAVVLTVPLTLAAGVAGAACVAFVVSPAVEVLVMSLNNLREMRSVVLRIVRVALPLGATSFLLERIVSSAASFALAAAICAVAAAGLLVIAERRLMLTLLRAVR